MTQHEAQEETKKFLHLIGHEFKLDDGELESVKAVVAWQESDQHWYPHVCFYNWGEDNPDGRISHMNVNDFMQKYDLS
jgi:hypothetical protein